MIILGNDDEVLTCSCGTKFVVTPKDFKVWSTGTELIKFTKCPKCGTPHHTILSISDGSEIVEVSANNENKKGKFMND